MKGIIFHYGLFKIVWDWFVLLLVIYTAVEVPFLVCFVLSNDSFQASPSGNGNSYSLNYQGNQALYVIYWFDIVVDVFFFCDIVVNLRTTYIEKNDQLVTCPKKIAIRYLRTYFIVDLVAAIPWDVIAGPYTRESTTSLSLLKTVRLLRLFQAARRLDQNYEKSVSLLFLMVFVFTLVAHWLSCIWYAIGHSENEKSVAQSWLSLLAEQSGQPINKTAGLEGPSLRSRYLTSLYFTLTCLTSVGFGNVAANTDFEKLFTIVSMLIGGLLFAAVFGNVSAIIYGHYSGTFKFRERMQSVKYFLGYHKIKGPLARKVKDYARHLWTQTKGISTVKVLKQFPQSLQEEISCYLHFNVIKNCPLFEHAEESCLWSLAIRMIQLHHLPNNLIVRQGTVVNCVYFINRGKLDVCRNGAVVGTIGEGDAFGNLCIGTNYRIRKSAVTLRSSSCVDIHILYLSDLNEVLELFPQFKKNLQKKTKTILGKTVLTSQILSSWDAIEVNEKFSERRGSHFSAWLGRQKFKRNCNVKKDKEYYHSSSNMEEENKLKETLVTIPLVVLSSAGNPNDDVQQRWRFANILECEEQNENLEETNRSASVSRSESSSQAHIDDELTLQRCLHKTNQCTHGDEENHSTGLLHPNINYIKQGSDPLEVISQGLDYSDDCDLHETTRGSQHNIHEMSHEKLESSIQKINVKLEILENKMDAILNFLGKTAKRGNEDFQGYIQSVDK